MKYVVKRGDIGIEKETILPKVVDAWEKLSLSKCFIFFYSFIEDINGRGGGVIRRKSERAVNEERVEKVDINTIGMNNSSGRFVSDILDNKLQEIVDMDIEECESFVALLRNIRCKQRARWNGG